MNNQYKCFVRTCIVILLTTPKTFGILVAVLLKDKKLKFVFLYILLVEVLVDLTDSTPQKKIWPEITDAVEAAPPADEKKAKGKEKEGAKKKIDVSSQK